MDPRAGGRLHTYRHGNHFVFVPGCVVTVSMRVMSTGTGYRYLLKPVAAADGNRDLSTPLTRYYADQGTPPGFWLGSGIADLGDGQLHPGDVVTEAQLQLLLGNGRTRSAAMRWAGHFRTTKPRPSGSAPASTGWTRI